MGLYKRGQVWWMRFTYKGKQHRVPTTSRFHDLRHTFATRLAQAGIDLYQISKLLGHKDIKRTQRYSHHCPDSLRSGVEVLIKLSHFYHSPMKTG